MKASVLLLAIGLGVASAVPTDVAPVHGALTYGDPTHGDPTHGDPTHGDPNLGTVWESWFGRKSISSAQESLLKQAAKSLKDNYNNCVKQAFKVQKYCEIKDADVMEKWINKCMEPINNIVLGQLKFEPKVLLSSEFAAGVKFDPAEMIKTIMGAGQSQCEVPRACVLGPKALSDIVK